MSATLADRERALLVQLAHKSWPVLLEITATDGPRVLLIVSPGRADQLRALSGFDIERLGAVGVYLRPAGSFVEKLSAHAPAPASDATALRIVPRDLAKTSLSLAAVWIFPSLSDPALVLTTLGAATRGLLS